MHGLDCHGPHLALKAEGTDSRIACPCPHCGEFVTPERQHLLGWQSAESKAEARRNAFFACPGCGHRITAEDRRAMNERAVLLHRGQAIDRQGKITGEVPDTDLLWFRWNAFNNMFWTAGEVGAKEWARLHAGSDEEAAEKELCQFYWAVPYASPDFDNAPLDPDRVRKRFGDALYTKQIVPDDVEVLTAAADLGKRIIHWMVIAWRPGCRGHVVDYGREDVPSDKISLERALLIGLENFRDDVILEGWRRLDGQVVVPQQVLVDAGWHNTEVYEFCRQKESGRRFRPAIGYGASARWRQYRTYHAPQKTGNEVKQIGDHYHVVWIPTERIFRIDADADFWKSWGHERLRQPQKGDDGMAEPGAMEFYASTDRNEHITLSQHLAAEHPETHFIEGRGDVTRWVRDKRKNHYLDTYYNNCVAGHLCGVRLIGRKPAAPAPPPAAVAPAPLRMPDGRPYLVTER